MDGHVIGTLIQSADRSNPAIKYNIKIDKYEFNPLVALSYYNHIVSPPTRNIFKIHNLRTGTPKSGSFTSATITNEFYAPIPEQDNAPVHFSDRIIFTLPNIYGSISKSELYGSVNFSCAVEQLSDNQRGVFSIMQSQIIERLSECLNESPKIKNSLMTPFYKKGSLLDPYRTYMSFEIAFPDGKNSASQINCDNMLDTPSTVFGMVGIDGETQLLLDDNGNTLVRSMEDVERLLPSTRGYWTVHFSIRYAYIHLQQIGVRVRAHSINFVSHGSDLAFSPYKFLN